MTEEPSNPETPLLLIQLPRLSAASSALIGTSVLALTTAETVRTAPA